MNPEAYRQLVMVGGEPFRWLKAMPADTYNPATGLYEDAGNADSDHGVVYLDQGEFRGLVTEQKASMLHPDLGWIRVSQLHLTTMPDEVRFGPFDKVVLLARTLVEREKLVRGQALTGQANADQLSQRHPVAVLTVSQGLRQFTLGTNCEFDAATGRLTWMGASPDSGATYAVEYTYRPVYWHLAEEFRDARPLPGGMTCVTPQRGLLSLKPPEA